MIAQAVGLAVGLGLSAKRNSRAEGPQYLGLSALIAFKTNFPGRCPGVALGFQMTRLRRYRSFHTVSSEQGYSPCSFVSFVVEELRPLELVTRGHGITERGV